MACVIALDLGSNSLKVLRKNCDELEANYSFLKTVRTAQDLKKTGLISKDAISRIVEAIKEAKNEINFNKCKISAVTTQALRVAKNSKEVIDEIAKKTGVVFRVISGDEEAKLTLLAVKKRVESLGIKKNFVLIDIGGASTEVIFYINGEIVSKSFDLGIVTVANSAKNLENIYNIVKNKMKTIQDFTAAYDNLDLEFVATAGTPTTIAAMKHNLTYESYDAKKVTGTILTIDELDFYLNKLLNMSKKEREIAVGVGRDDLIIAGVVIYKEFYKLFNKKTSIVVDDGLVMGVAIISCES